MSWVTTVAKDPLGSLLRAQRKISKEAQRAAAIAVRRFPAVRNAISRLSFELGLLADSEGTYGSRYYGMQRDPADRQGASGYERYDRTSSHANKAAYIIWRHFPVHRTLDVGCALGFVVEALCELGIDARGTDFSAFALNHAPSSVRGRLFFGDLKQGLPFGDGSFDLVSAFETLEHLSPDLIDGALAELFRVARHFAVVTIPSFGTNGFGPPGWFEGKVRPERLEYYKGLGPQYRGPIPFKDLARDVYGQPVEGHLTIASFDWWRERFAHAGFVHSPDLEQRIYTDLSRFGLVGAWNLYVMRRANVDPPPVEIRAAQQLKGLEAKWGLPA